MSKDGDATELDIAGVKRAEDALRESEYRLRQIFETVPSQLWSADPAGELTQYNQRMLDYTGMRFEDFKHGVGRHSCTRTTFQRLQGLSLTQFRPERRTRL